MYTYSELPESEKIDRTYKMLVSMQRARWISLAIRVLIIGGLYYGYHYLQQPENAETKERIKTEVRARLSEIVVPLVQDLMGDILQGMQTGGAPSAGGAVVPNGGQPVATPTITPEMIQAVRDSMQK